MHKSVFAAMLFTLAACATATTPEEQAEKSATRDRAYKAATYLGDPRRGEPVSGICFSGGIDGFRGATRHSVIVSRGARDYLVTTRSTCRDLESAGSLAFDQTSTCLGRGDRIQSFPTAFGPHRTDMPSIPCVIDQVYAWTDTPAPPETPAP